MLGTVKAETVSIEKVEFGGSVDRKIEKDERQVEKRK